MIALEHYADLAFLVGLGIGLLLVGYGTVAKTRWGINVRRVSCPNCGAEFGRVRVPNSGRQAVWGGYTCHRCRCEADKWGRRVATDDQAS
jgi:hypothetical protein